ncbi:hypothetical protein [Luteolibacter marinus]|uniref:hypothetical protein n=1 Tax=Luteolibacter marinus TaxID=2776705 RepID=UPI00186660D9|nr:hypothetical protein [Luteolibacter marinus]
MKSSHLIATATALVGFAAGWILKPGAADPTPQDVAGAGGIPGKRPVAVGGKLRERDERPLILKARGGGEAEADPKTVSAQIKFENSFGDATERAENARLTRLAEALGLSPEQRDMVKVMLANRRDGFRQLNGGGKPPAEVLGLATQAERRFEGELEKILDQEQFDAYHAFKEREKENDIEARAQRDLADLIGQIDLSPEQRDRAYEVLLAGSADAASKRPEGWALLNESFGIIGGAHSEVMEQMGDVMMDPEGMDNPQQVHQRLIEAQRSVMNWKINQLTPILTPGQLAQYRATLAARSTLMEQHAPPSMPPR